MVSHFKSINILFSVTVLLFLINAFLVKGCTYFETYAQLYILRYCQKELCSLSFVCV